MFNVKSSFALGTPRGRPGLPGGRGRRFAVAVTLMAVCLLQTGCRSGGFGSCGSSSGVLSRTTSRIMRPFHRDKNACCGTEVVADGCVSSAVPMEGVVSGPIVSPGTMITPAPQIGTPSTVAPLDSPSALEPIPSETRPESRTGPAPGSTRRSPSGSGTRAPSNYESQGPDDRSTQSRSDNLAHTLISTPAPAARPVQDSGRGGLASGRADADSTFDHLPPLDLPGEVSEKSSTPPVAPAAERKPQAPAPAGDPLGGRSPRGSDLALTASTQTASDPTSTSALAPGIERFVAVDSRLAGGSVPSAKGLDWLASKGYKTLVDLRDTTETDVAFITEATRRGLRYIALPLSSKNLDREHVARFNFELASADARPLYFFDSRGARAGALWYVRRLTVDQVTSDVARGEARDLGCGEGEDWLAATNYIDRLGKPRSQPSQPAPSVPASVSRNLSTSGISPE